MKMNYEIIYTHMFLIFTFTKEQRHEVISILTSRSQSTPLTSHQSCRCAGNSALPSLSLPGPPGPSSAGGEYISVYSPFASDASISSGFMIEFW